MLKYYYDLMSQPCRALYIFLNKTKIPYDKCVVDLSGGQHKTEEYIDIHPFSKVPAINDSGFKLIESVAIFRYLCHTYPDNVADHWYPKDLQRRALVDQYLEWQHNNMRFFGSLYFWQKWLIPKATGNPPKPERVAMYQSGMEKVLKDFENFWLKDSQFVAGSEVSFADLLAVCEMYQPAMAGYNVFTEHPRLAEWHERVKSYFNPEFDEANSVISPIIAQHDMAKL